MSHQDRLDEVRSILDGLARHEEELRDAAGRALGQVDHVVFVGLNAQMALVNTLRQTLRVRAGMLEAAGQAAGPRLVQEDESGDPAA